MILLIVGFLFLCIDDLSFSGMIVFILGCFSVYWDECFYWDDPTFSEMTLVILG